MTTNDPQAGYLAEQREPMEAMNITILRAIETYKIEGELGVKYPVPLWRDIMAIITAKITSGELMVVKTTSLTDTDVDDITWWACTECNTNVGEGIYQPKWKFCPGCGARIIE